MRLRRIVNLPYDVFPDAYVDSIVFVASRPGLGGDGAGVCCRIAAYPRRAVLNEVDESDPRGRFSDVDPCLWWEEDPEYLQIRSCLTREELQIRRKVRATSLRVDAIADVQRGVTPFHPESGIPDKEHAPALAGEFRRYSSDEQGGLIAYYSPSLMEYRPPSLFQGRRVLLRSMISRQFRLQATCVDGFCVHSKSVQCTHVHENIGYSTFFILSIFNSVLLSSHFVMGSSIALRDDFPKLVLEDNRALPMRRVNFTTPLDEREALAQDLKDVYQAGGYDSVLAQTERLLPQDAAGSFLAFQDGPNWKYDPDTKTGEGACPEKSDVVHDFLAHLAEQMIELHKQKQAEAKRFLDWLVKQLRITSTSDGKEGLDALTGKTRLRDYLGDYQKGEEHLSFDDFLATLQKNRSRIGTSLSDPAFINRLRAEYESTLARLLPIKERLAKTDWLIDQVVYRLYGLTTEEIGIVEGKREDVRVTG